MLSMNGLKVGKYVPTSAIKTGPLTDKYTVGEKIGRGKFAVVHKCIINDTQEVVAGKFIRKRRTGKSAREEILREVVMLEMAMAHPRLVNLLEVYETPSELILITEYCEGGELFHECVIEESFREEDVVRLVIQILEGLVYLHEQDIVHLDLKPQNILLTKPFPHGDIKICDLGFACLVHSGEDIRDIIGTADYVAPEVLDYEPLNIQTDMWSMGVLTYVMLTAFSPFAGDNQQETFCNISTVNLDFPDELFGDKSQHCQDFISRLLVKNAKKRLTARQCLEHPWLKSYFIQSNLPPTVSNSNEIQSEEPVSECNENNSDSPPPIVFKTHPGKLQSVNPDNDDNPLFISSVNYCSNIDTVTDINNRVTQMNAEENNMEQSSQILATEDINVDKPESHSCDIVSVGNICDHNTVNYLQNEENKKNMDKTVSKVTYSVKKMIVLKPTVPPRLKPKPSHLINIVKEQNDITQFSKTFQKKTELSSPTVEQKSVCVNGVEKSAKPSTDFIQYSGNKMNVPKSNIPPPLKPKPSHLINFIKDQTKNNTQFCKTFEKNTEFSPLAVNGIEKSSKPSMEFIHNPVTGNDVKINFDRQRNSFPCRSISDGIKNKDKDESFKRRSMEIPIKRLKSENDDLDKLASTDKTDFNCVEEVILINETISNKK